MRQPLPTTRLVLRPTTPTDIERALEIRANPEVARNLASATLPPDREKMASWFVGHAEEWRQGMAYRFAITLDARLIGVCDVFDVAGGQGEIGYWLDRSVWGQGYGLEAAERLVRFAMDDLGLTVLVAGCADDNAASAAILQHLGFARLDDARVFSHSRQLEITQRRFRLEPRLESQMIADVLGGAFIAFAYGLMDPWTWIGIAVGIIAGAFHAPWRFMLGAAFVFLPIRLALWSTTADLSSFAPYGLTLASVVTIIAAFAFARAIVPR